MRREHEPFSHPAFAEEAMFECATSHPPEGEIVRLYFATGELLYGFWDGYQWRGNQRILEPEYWQHIGAELRLKLLGRV